jgi:hypothetical protein
MKKLLAGLALALLTTVPAQAVTVSGNIAPGATVDVLSGPYDFNAEFLNSDGAGSFQFTFTNTTSSYVATTVSFATVNQGVLGRLAYFFTGGATFTWLGSGDTHTVAQGALDSFDLFTSIAAGGSDTLVITFGDPVGVGNVGPDIDFTVLAQVPVPAGGLLLLGGLAGLAALRRRNHAVAA